MGRVTTRVPVERVTIRDGAILRTRRPDTLAVEEPLEVRAAGKVLTVTMRTPGADIDLIHGYLFAEGVITTAADIRGARYCAGAVATGPDGLDQNTYNVLDVDLLRPDLPLLDAATRSGLTSSACGVCGSASIERILERVPGGVGFDASPGEGDGGAGGAGAISVAGILAILDTLRSGQRTFAKTGGLHGAALTRLDGTVIAIAEDVGRHNAVDKVIGAALRSDAFPLADAVLAVSSRASFEIVQKAAIARIPIVVAVSAPSSLAVETASALGMTLVAFARDSGLNIYSGFDRVG